MGNSRTRPERNDGDPEKFFGKTRTKKRYDAFCRQNQERRGKRKMPTFCLALILMMILMEDTTVQPNDVLRRTRARELPS